MFCVADEASPPGGSLVGEGSGRFAGGRVTRVSDPAGYRPVFAGSARARAILVLATGGTQPPPFLEESEAAWPPKAAVEGERP